MLKNNFVKEFENSVLELNISLSNAVHFKRSR